MADRDLFTGGIHATRIALEYACEDVLELWARRNHNSPPIADLETTAQGFGIAIHHVERDTLDKLYMGIHHQGVVLRRRVPRPLKLREFLDNVAALRVKPLILALDGIQDPRNFGACLRVSDGAGVDAVVHTRDKSVRLTNAVAKAASGAIDTVPRVTVVNLATALGELKEAGIWVTGTTPDCDEQIYSSDLTGARALVLGNESEGLRRLTRVRCDQLVSIPLHGKLESLNVASAAAICLFEACRQRTSSG